MKGRFALRFLAGRSLASVALLASGGCSFVYVGGPPPDHARRESFQCETGRGLPLIDLAVGSGLVVWGFTAGETTSESFGQTVTSSSTDNLVTGLVAGVPFLAGAAWGFREVHRCREALRALARRSTDEAARAVAARGAGARQDP